MCGVVGVVGNQKATDILVQGLEKLQYRGYDSAGIFVETADQQTHLVKTTGSINDLQKNSLLLIKVLLGLVIRAGQRMVALRLKMRIRSILTMNDFIWYIME